MAEMMPSVSVPRSSAPRGLPMAATASPTESLVGAELRRAQTLGLYLEHREVADPVHADELGLELSVVPERHSGGICALNYVGVRGDVAVL